MGKKIAAHHQKSDSGGLVLEQNCRPELEKAILSGSLPPSTAFHGI